MIDTFRNLVHFSSILVLIIAIAVVLVGLVKPRLFGFLMREFTDRRFIGVMGVFVGLLCGTVFIATQSPADIALESQTEKRVVDEVSQIEQTQVEPSPTTIEEVDIIEKLAFAKRTENDATLPAGQTRLIQQGVAGEKVSTWNVTKENGQETANVLKSEVITAEPIPEVTAIGTMQPATTVATPAPKAAEPPKTTANKPTTNAKAYNTPTSCKHKAGALKLVICLPNY